MRRLEQDLFPVIGRKPIRDITSQMMLDVIRRIEERSAFEMARRAMQMSGHIFRYAVLTNRAEKDPTQALKGALKPYKKGNYAAMEIKEFPEFLAKLNRNEARLFPTTRIMFDLMMLTFVRTSELIKAEWSEFDLDAREWRIPAERMKMRKEHIVPLSKQAIAHLKELKRINGDTKYVFPSQRDPRKHISNNAILVALDRMGYRGIHTGHGFRALAMSTIKEKLGYRHEVVDRQLAHAPGNQVDKAYDRAKFLDERTEMMQKWADYIDKQTKIGLTR
jgi:integrase